LDKALTNLGSGFFSIDLTIAESNQLVDDSYSYSIEQSGQVLKYGFVRYIDGTLQEDGGELDSELDFILA